MTRVWKVGAWPGIGHNTNEYREKYIDKAIEKEFVAIGGADRGDLTKLWADELSTLSQSSPQWYRFSHEIRQGDVILQYDNCRGRRKAYAGLVIKPPKRLRPNLRHGEAYYWVPPDDELRFFEKKEGKNYAPNRVNVRWLSDEPLHVMIDWWDTLHEILEDDIRDGKTRPKKQKGRPRGVWVYDSKFRMVLLGWLKGKPVNQQDRNNKEARAGSGWKTIDPDRKASIEDVAIKLTREDYKKRHYTVTPVENENKGWDLEASRKNENLRLEVKGLSGRNISIQLTPNEYRNAKKSADYRICVVTEALEDPLLHIFKYSEALKRWEDKNGNALVVKEMTGAWMFSL